MGIDRGRQYARSSAPRCSCAQSQRQVLCLRRKEKKEDNPLHEKIVIWAGGHVRKEDSHSGNSLLQHAIRGLQEELRLSVNPTNLKLIGSVYADHGGSTSKHVAVVYEWRAETDDVCSIEQFGVFRTARNFIRWQFRGSREIARSVVG